MKKYVLLLLVLGVALFCTACGRSDSAKTIEGTLPEIIDRIYESADVDDDTRDFLENSLATVAVEKESAAYYFGTDTIDFTDAVASEPRMSSIAFSVCLMRVPEGTDVEAAKAEIRDTVDPRKWICVEANDVLVESEGDLILLVMTADSSSVYAEAFHKLAE